MTKATELFPTLESLVPYVGEVWEDDTGSKSKLLGVGEKRVFYAEYDDEEDAAGLDAFLICNNLPQSIRNAPKPKTVELELWESVAWDKNSLGYRSIELHESRESAESRADHWKNVLIRKLPPAEYEVINGGE